MGDLFYFNFSGKNVLFKVTECQEHYFQGEFIYPYSFRMDYLSETETFISYGFSKILYHLIENIYLTLNDLIDNVEELQKDTDKFRLYHKKVELKKDDILPITIERYIETRSQYYIPRNWGEMLKKEVIDAFYKILSGNNMYKVRKPELEYEEIFKRYIYKHRIFTEVNSERHQIYDFTLIERFLLETGYANYKLKRINYRGTHNIPNNYIEICDADQYFLKEENRLPLIIGGQLGTSPPLSKEFMEKLEGQEAVILARSIYSGIERAINLVKFSDGKYEKLTTVWNTQ